MIYFKTTLLTLTLISFASLSAMDSNLNEKSKQQLQVNATSFPTNNDYSVMNSVSVRQNGELQSLNQKYNELKLKHNELKLEFEKLSNKLEFEKLSNDLKTEKDKYFIRNWIQKIYGLLNKLQSENKIDPELTSRLRFQGRVKIGDLHTI